MSQNDIKQSSIENQRINRSKTSRITNQILLLMNFVCVWLSNSVSPPRLWLLCLYFAIDIDFICAWFVVLCVCMCVVCTMCACVYQKCKSCVCIRYATKWNNAYACGHRPGRVRVHSSRNWIFFAVSGAQRTNLGCFQFISLYTSYKKKHVGGGKSVCGKHPRLLLVSI